MPAACGILAPQPGIEPVPPEVEARSLNHWTTREVPEFCFYTWPGHCPFVHSISQTWGSLTPYSWNLENSIGLIQEHLRSPKFWTYEGLICFGLLTSVAPRCMCLYCLRGLMPQWLLTAAAAVFLGGLNPSPARGQAHSHTLSRPQAPAPTIGSAEISTADWPAQLR